jgi:hypothetical protein
MRDEERAELIIRMSLLLRAEARAGLDPHLWERTMEAVRARSDFAAKCAAGCMSGAAAVRAKPAVAARAPAPTWAARQHP